MMWEVSVHNLHTLELLKWVKPDPREDFPLPHFQILTRRTQAERVKQVVMPFLVELNPPTVPLDLDQAFQKHVSIITNKYLWIYTKLFFNLVDSIASSQKAPMTEKYSEINENDEWTAI